MTSNTRRAGFYQALAANLESLREQGLFKAERIIVSRQGAEVECDGALIARNRRPPQAVAVLRDPPAAHRIALVGGLDLDHFRPVVTEKLAGERPSDEAPELEHTNTSQRTHEPRL